MIHTLSVVGFRFVTGRRRAASRDHRLTRAVLAFAAAMLAFGAPRAAAQDPPLASPGASRDARPLAVPAPVTAAPLTPADTLGDGEILDVNRIDPEAFQAIAARLPAGQAPRIDGHLDDAVWALAPAQGNFIQREPRFGARTTERTEFRILYDDRRIYFAVWAWDREPGASGRAS